MGESKKRWVTFNCKTECTVMSKRGTPSLELHIGDAKIKQLWKFNYLDSVINERKHFNGRMQKENGKNS